MSQHPSASRRQGRRLVGAGLATVLVTTGTLVAPPAAAQAAPIATQVALPPEPGSAGVWTNTYTEAGPSGRTFVWTIQSRVSSSHVETQTTEEISFDITTVTEITTPIDPCVGNTGSDAYDTHPEPLLSDGWFVWPMGPQTPPWLNGDLFLPQSSQVTDGDVFTTSAPCETYFRETTTQAGVLRNLGFLDSNPSTVATDGGCYTPVSWNARLSGAPDGYDGGSFATVAVGDALCVESADLSVTMTAPAEVRKDANILYEMTVVNQGPGVADNIYATLTLPPFVRFVAGAAGGICTADTDPAPPDTPVCKIVDLPSNHHVVLTVQAKSPNLPPRPLVASVKVFSATYDPDLSNNTASATTQLIDAQCERANAQITAGFSQQQPTDPPQEYLTLDAGFTWCGGAGEPATITPGTVSLTATTDITIYESLLASAGIHFRAPGQSAVTDVTPASFIARGTFEACIDTVQMLSLVGGPGVRAVLRNWSRLPLRGRAETLRVLQRILRSDVIEAVFLPGFDINFCRLMVRQVEQWLSVGFDAIARDGFGVFCFDFWKPVMRVSVDAAGVHATPVSAAPVGSVVRVRVNDLIQ